MARCRESRHGAVLSSGDRAASDDGELGQRRGFARSAEGDVLDDAPTRAVTRTSPPDDSTVAVTELACSDKNEVRTAFTRACSRQSSIRRLGLIESIPGVGHHRRAVRYTAWRWTHHVRGTIASSGTVGTFPGQEPRRSSFSCAPRPEWARMRS